MNKSRTLIKLTFIASLTLFLILPIASARPPPYIQTGFKFIYQLIDDQTQQSENAYHSYLIQSVTSQKISIRIESDVTRSIDLEVDIEGNIIGGRGRIDLWIPDNLQVGQTLNIMDYDALVAHKNLDLDKTGKITFTAIASTDQKTFWLYVDGGSASEAKQLLGLLYAIVFPSSGKFLVLVNIQQGQSVVASTTTTVKSVSKTTMTSTSTHTTVGTTLTKVVVTEETSTVTQVIVTTVASTATVERTVTYQTQVAETSFQPFIPIPVAVAASIAIIGGGLFYVKARKRPPPSTYPYPLTPTLPQQALYSPPTYPTPIPPQQVIGRCPACGYPLYAEDKDCRRCNYRFA